MSRLVVVGAGMVAHRFVANLRAAPDGDRWDVAVLGEEPVSPYDRVSLSGVFGAGGRVDLSLPGQREAAQWQLGDPVVAIDRDRRIVTTAAGVRRPYDVLVLATGSAPFVPPVHGCDAAGCFTFRTVADVAAITTAARRAKRAVVIGGGLLGLEAAGGLLSLGIAPSVVELADRLLPLQVDAGGGAALRRLVLDRGVAVHTGVSATAIEARRGRVSAVVLSDGTRLAAGLVVFAVGVRPRDELARAAGLELGRRGGVVVDSTCRTSDPAIYAIGECASFAGRCYGLVAPGYQMAMIAAGNISGRAAPTEPFETSTKLKLLGVDVGSFGDAMAATPGALEVVLSDPVAGRYRKLVLSDDAQTLLGGVLVGAADDYASLRAAVGGPLPGTAVDLAVGLSAASGSLGTAIADDASVCSCQNVSAGQIRAAITDGCRDVAAVKACTGAATGCGSCLPLVRRLLDAQLQAQGIEIDTSLCEHFAYSRPQLFELVRMRGLVGFTRIVEEFGTGRGCDICKPVVASILASLGRGHVLDGENASVQDTNDFVLANIQRDGTYSVVPRIPGGEITPTRLRVIADVAARFDLYTKITGGQRIALFGARIDQLPGIWRELVAAGFESGQAYGKAVRTVKSCVGSTWCRFGVQDSVGMAIALELRYRGLRSPHKLKFAVSGCARECAEARSKDVGVIATEHGWNLYVGGNGGFTPRHAQLLAEDLDNHSLIRLTDRFVMYYIRTADRLQRTAAWLEAMDGGLTTLRQVLLADSLGIGSELEAAMATHIDSYSDEWQATLDDPAKLAHFVSFVNHPDQVDAGLAFDQARDQRIPALSPRLVDVSISRFVARGEPLSVSAAAAATR